MIESLRLEKTPKVIQSSHQPTTNTAHQQYVYLQLVKNGRLSSIIKPHYDYFMLCV